MQVKVFHLDLRTGRPLTQSDYTRSCINTIVLLRIAQGCSKHVENSNKHITEEIVRQGGYLPALYEDARPEKYKILNKNVFYYF
jgi:hypothetical protein